MDQFLNRFGLISLGQIEPFPGSPPDHSHTAALIKEMQRQHVQLILIEPFYETRSAKTIARASGAKLLILPTSALGAKPAIDYISLLDYDVDSLANTLK